MAELAPDCGGLNGHSLAEPQVIPEVRITLATMADIATHWEWIRNGLRWVKQRTTARNPNFPCLWEPQHILREVEAGWTARMRNEAAITEMWLSYNAAGKPIALAVTQRTGDPFLYVGLGWFVWIAFHDPKDTSNVVDMMDDYLTEVAKSRGMEWFECLTRRDGLARRMARKGWEEHMVVLRKRVYPQEND